MKVYIPILVAFCLLVLATKRWRDGQYRGVATIAFLGHLLLSFVVIPRLPYGWDIREYHQVATAIESGQAVTASQTVSSFAAFQGLLYTLFEPRPATLGVFNGLFAVLVAIPVASLARDLYPTLDWETPAVVLAALFLPLPFLYMSVPMRDGLSVLTCLTLLAVCLRAYRTDCYVGALPAIPLWGLLSLVRRELALIVLLGVVAAAMVRVVRQRGAESLPSLTGLAAVLGALGFGLFAQFLLSFERVNAQLRERAAGGAVYLDGLTYHSWFDVLLAAPVRGLYFQFAPFPLHVESMFHLLALFWTVFVIILLVGAVRSLVACRYEETAVVLLGVVYVTGIVGYGLINSNFGTNVRHRMVFDFLLVVFASPLLHRWWLRARSWVGVAPRQPGDDDEQQGETEELHGRSHRGRQDPNETRDEEQPHGAG